MRAQRLAKPALAFAALLASLALVELVCRWTRDEPRSLETVAPGLRERDALLGYRGQANARVRASKRYEGEVVFDVEYELDEHGRRATPATAGAMPERYIACFGDSFTFGHGLAQSETLPAQLARVAPEHRAYNYGLPGWGPQQTLALLESRDLRAEIAEKAGVALYTFIDAHVGRAIGSMHDVRWQSRNAPCYELDGDGSLARLGSFADARPWTTRAYSLLAGSAAITRMGVELPVRSAKHYELVAALFERMAQLAHERIGCEKFVVLWFPGSTRGAVIEPFLDRELVTVLDYANLDDRAAHERIAHDGHPTAAAFATIALRVASDLGLD